MYVDDVRDSMRTRGHTPPSPHFAPSGLRGGTATQTNTFIPEYHLI